MWEEGFGEPKICVPVYCECRTTSSVQLYKPRPIYSTALSGKFGTHTVPSHATKDEKLKIDHETIDNGSRLLVSKEEAVKPCTRA